MIAGAILAKLAAPVVLGSVYLVAYIVFVTWSRQSKVMNFGCLSLFVSKVLFTKLIPESYALATFCGLDAAFSGLLISVYPGAHIVGYIMTWNATRDGATKQAEKLHTMLAAIPIFYTAGTLGFALAVDNIERLPGTWSVAAVLLLCRAIAGISGGLIYACLIIESKTGPPEQLMANSVKLSVANAVGIGSGPWLASASLYLRKLASATDFSYYDDVMLCLVLCVAARALLAPPAERDDTQALSKAPSGNSTGSPIWWCATLCSARAFVISASEVVTAFVLEDSAGWAVEQIGLAIGTVFLCSIPVKSLMEHYFGGITETSVLFLLSGALLATLLLACVAASSLEVSWSLLCLDSLLLPQLILVGGFLDGVMMSLPSFFADGPSMAIVQLLRGICTDGVGRFIGPPVSRWVVATMGEQGLTAYSLLQLAVVLYMVLVAKGVVLLAYGKRKTLGAPNSLASISVPSAGDMSEECEEDLACRP